MISANKLIGWFQIMYRQKWRYKWGSAKENEVDCSGAFTYAYAFSGTDASRYDRTRRAGRRRKLTWQA